MPELGNILGGMSNDNTSMKQSMINQGRIPAYYQDFLNRLKLNETLIINKRFLAADVFILSHDTQCMMPETSGGAGYYLTETASSVTNMVRVINGNNLFVESFGGDRFIDASMSNANIDDYNKRVLFDSDEVLSSEIVAMNDTAYGSFNLSVEGNYDNLAGMVSVDGGTSFCEADFNQSYNNFFRLPVSKFSFEDNVLDSGSNGFDGTIKVSASAYYPFRVGVPGVVMFLPFEGED